MNPSSHLIEINLISAQNLECLQSFAVVSIDPAFKLRTAAAPSPNPTWNEKFVFRVPAALLSPDSSSAICVEIRASAGCCFPGRRIGNARILLSNLRLLNLPADGVSFSAAGLRRDSGRIGGIVNVGAAVVGRVPAFVAAALAGAPAVGYRDFIRDCKGISRPVIREGDGEIKGLICGLGFGRKIHASPSDQNLLGLNEKKERS